jgi:hypothetical protein
MFKLSLSKKCLPAACFMIALPSTILAQDASSVIGGASKAMGADKLTTIQYSGSGYDFAMGQAYSPTSPWPKFIVKTYTRSIDFRVPASREDRVRLQFENPPRGGGLQPVIGERRQNQTIVVADNTPWAQQLEIWMTPHGFLKAAAANHAAVKPQTVAGKKYSVVTFTGQNKAAVNGYLNEQNMVERVETRIDNPMLGDMPFTVVYTDYKDFGGVKFPSHIVQSQGDYPILDLTVSEVKPNAPVTIEAPPGRGGGGEGAADAGATLPPRAAGGVEGTASRNRRLRRARAPAGPVDPSRPWSETSGQSHPGCAPREAAVDELRRTPP